MSIKKKLGLGIASAALGISLVGGGTFAYFNDVETSTGNTFTAGTIDLKPELTSSTKININDIKPGDTFSYTIPLENAGSLPADLYLDIANYTFVKANLGAVLEITEIKLGTKSFPLPTDGLTLAEAASEAKMAVGSLASGESLNLVVKGKFKNENYAQNEYQGSSVTADAVFELRQQQ